MGKSAKAYRLNDHQKALKERALWRAAYRCEMCGRAKWRVKHLFMHHNTYVRVGAEDLGDVRILCKWCHWAWHNKRGDNRQKSLETRMGPGYFKAGKFDVTRWVLENDPKRNPVTRAFREKGLDPGAVSASLQIPFRVLESIICFATPAAIRKLEPKTLARFCAALGSRPSELSRVNSENARRLDDILEFKPDP